MTTKRKIILGFFIMVVLMGVMALLGYRNLSLSSELFAEYDRISILNTAMSDAVGTLNDSAYRLELYLRLKEAKDVDSSIEAMKSMQKKLEAAFKITKDPSRVKRIEEVLNTLALYLKALDSLKANQEKWNASYLNEIVPVFEDLIQTIGDLGDQVASAGNAAAIRNIHSLWKAVVALENSLRAFDNEPSQKLAENVAENLTETKRVNGILAAILVTAEGKRIEEAMSRAINKISTAFEKNKPFNLEAWRLLLQTYEWDKIVTGNTNKVSEETEIVQRNLRTTSYNESSSAKTMMAGASAVGLIIGLLFAMFIIFSLSKTLNKISAFAAAVSSGKFDYDPHIQEKGEIGHMVESIQKIPAVLKNILTDYQMLEQQIEEGALNSQGDENKYQGGFATIVNGTNGIINRFRHLIDCLPSPVLTLDKNLMAAFLNLAARKATGVDDYKGKPMKQLFNRDDANTPEDAVRKAIANKQSAAAETQAHPNGTDMDISYTVVPILDKNENLTSLIQLVTDLTEIKKTQRTIKNVANQAATIADRVAAASEELSAQVEQVSHGAEMQRARVESTASAMTEMNATVLEVAKNAGQAAEQGDLTKNKATDGASLVNQVVQSINLVNQVATTLQNNMQDLGHQAESIGGVMNVISDIADQTNLLALNAAIEAARAGEAGRGFAVVADEVRKLAEKTMSATQEVGASITAIQQSTHTNIKEVEAAAKAITAATALADSSGQALAEIVHLAAANSQVVTSIATAAEEQSATSEEINHSIEEINGVVGETTDGMLQASKAVQELSQMAQELNKVMAELQH